MLLLFSEHAWVMFTYTLGLPARLLRTRLEVCLEKSHTDAMHTTMLFSTDGTCFAVGRGRKNPLWLLLF